MKGAEPYSYRYIGFLYEDEEDTDYLRNFDVKSALRKEITESDRIIFLTCDFNFARTFIGEVIAKNRLDVIEMLQKKSVDWNRICCTISDRSLQVISYTPLQFSLLAKRYEIAQFLIDHGARIE